MPITFATVKIGEAVWRAVAPVKLVKTALNKRRARRGKPLLPITDEDYTMLPNGSATHTGAAIAGTSPIVGLLVTAFVPKIEAVIVQVGMAPAECAPEAAGCVTAAVMAVGLVTGMIAMLGGALASWGRERAAKRHAAELAAAAKPAA